MAVTIKTEAEIECMREAGRLIAIIQEELKEALKPGISTADVDELCEKLIRSCGCIPNFKNYEGYPASVCVSVNEEVVHGIPSKNRIIQEGDIVSLDTGLIYKGYHSDCARTHGVGEVSPEVAQLMAVTEQSFFEGIKFAKAGNHLYDISKAIEGYIKPYHYGIVRDLTGHGIGTHLHEDPVIPNFKPFGKGIKLEAGMTLAVEPMVNLGTYKVLWKPDGWTVISADKSMSAHYENTILITNGEPEILTLLPKK